MPVQGPLMDRTAPFAGPYNWGPAGFQNVVIPCRSTTTGGNIVLTPPSNIQWYGKELLNQQVFGAFADASPTGNIFINVANLGPKPVYFGSDAANAAILEGEYYQVSYDSDLGDDGGFHLQVWNGTGSSAQGNTHNYSTYAAIQATKDIIPIGDLIVQNGYYSPGDGGQASYKAVESEPDHPGKVQTASGRWGEIIGPVYNLAALGAKLDCPNVSGIDPTNQTLITSLVTAATNDIAIYRNALIIIDVKGCGEITWGNGLRIAYTREIPGLGHPANTTVLPQPGAWIEIDPTLAIDWATLPAPPAGRAWIEGTMGAGDPVTCTRKTFTVSAISGASWIFPAGTAVLADFTPNIHWIRINMGQHIWTNWRGIPNGAQRYRIEGIASYLSYGSSIEDCQFYGLTNDGCRFFAGWDNIISYPISTKCGFGAQRSTGQNGVTMFGIKILGSPELSTHGCRIIGPTTYGNKDEGVAFTPQNDLVITDVISNGDQDRAVEGFLVSTTVTSASLGEDIGNEVLIDNVLHNGYGYISRGNATGTTLSGVVAHWLSTNDESGNRSVFITGAGPAGGDGPFTIVSVDYVANTVTLGTPVTTPVTNAIVYTKSMNSVTPSAGNDGRVTLKTVRSRNLYTLADPVRAAFAGGGHVTVKDVVIEDSIIGGNFSGVTVAATYSVIQDVTTRNVSGGTGSSVANIRGDNVSSATIRNVNADSGFTYGVTIGNSIASTVEMIVEDINAKGATQNMIRIINGADCRTVKIGGNIGQDLNQGASSGAPAISMQLSGTPTFGVMEFTGNVARMNSPSNYPIMVTSGILAAGAIDTMIISDNDWGPSEFYQPGLYPVSFDNSGGVVTNFIDRNNKMYGQRQVYAPISVGVGVIPTTGTFGLGDIAINPLPLAGGAPSWECVTPGTFGALGAGATVTAIVTSSRVIPFSSVTGLVKGSYVTIAGIATPQRITKISGLNVIVPVAISVANGAAVANQTPVLKASAALAA